MKAEEDRAEEEAKAKAVKKEDDAKARAKAEPVKVPAQVVVGEGHDLDLPAEISPVVGEQEGGGPPPRSSPILNKSNDKKYQVYPKTLNHKP